MGLTWKDAVTLLNIHTLSFGNMKFSAHLSTWAPNDKEAQVFYKKYFMELFGVVMIPRAVRMSHQDSRTDNPNSSHLKMILNPDMRLLVKVHTITQCCSRTNMFTPNVQSRYDAYENLSRLVYSRYHPCMEIAD
ncbi:hypothetical protein ACHAW6_013167 [Cyclotella cf. meneghiniana]